MENSTSLPYADFVEKPKQSLHNITKKNPKVNTEKFNLYVKKTFHITHTQINSNVYFCNFTKNYN
jgi:hypothetical protein